MITNTITNIVTTPSVDGSSDSISFDVTSTDGLGNTASRNVVETNIGIFAITGETLTDDELNAECDAIATKRGIYDQLARELLTQTTPVYIIPPPLTPPTDAQIRANLTMRVDVAARSVYDRFTSFQVEYDPREAAAQAYKDAGYTGDPTAWVTDFTDNAGLTVQAGVDLILSQASTLRAAIQTLAGYRMRKYKITNATTLDLAQQEYDSIILDINTLSASLT